MEGSYEAVKWAYDRKFLTRIVKRKQDGISGKYLQYHEVIVWSDNPVTSVLTFQAFQLQSAINLDLSYTGFTFNLNLFFLNQIFYVMSANSSFRPLICIWWIPSWICTLVYWTKSLHRKMLKELIECPPHRYLHHQNVTTTWPPWRLLKLSLR